MTIAGVSVEPGDIVVADDDGAVAVPAGRWDEVLRAAEHVEHVEEAIVAAVHDGSTLAQARSVHGYTLQTRRGRS